MGDQSSSSQATASPRRRVFAMPYPRFTGLFLCAFLILLSVPLLLQLSSTHTFVYDGVHKNNVWQSSFCAGLSESSPATTIGDVRAVSDRFEEGSPDTLILNATIWTGNDTLTGDILLSRGLIREIGNLSELANAPSRRVHVVHADGAWVTPGLVDLDSHAGVQSIPLRPSVDSSRGSGLHPLVSRTLDAFDTHDPAFFMAAVGGVTAAHITADLANSISIAGEAFVVKHRRTREGTAESMVIEPPWNSTSRRWYHISHHVDGAEAAWKLEHAYRQAAEIRNAQIYFCSRSSKDDDLPLYLQHPALEPLVDVLRGRAKVSIYASEVRSLVAIARLSNEFKFSVTTIQNADEAWLAPTILNNTFGDRPVIGLASTRHRTSLESYRGSVFAPQVLSDAGYLVAMKTGHPRINSRFLLQEAQIAHHFGLSAEKALASVTTVPAQALGLGHRIGWLRKGHDADVVLWNGSPLHLGTVPQMVWIDGVLMINSSRKINASSLHSRSETLDWAKERDIARMWDGVPPLDGEKRVDTIVFKNVKTLWLRRDGKIEEDESLHSDTVYLAESKKSDGTVVVKQGKIICVGRCDERGKTIDIRGGSISPSFMSFGSTLGLEEIEGDVSTGIGPVYDPFSENTPLLVGDVAGITRGAGTLQFGTQHALQAYRSGVTMGTSHVHMRHKLGALAIQGVSATFRTGSDHLLARGALIQDKVALHVSILRADQRKTSIGSVISVIRRLLLGSEATDNETGRLFHEAATGVIPLVVAVDDADIMGLLIQLKYEVEDMRGSSMRMVFFGGAEAHLIAEEIAGSKTGVILSPAKPSPTLWDQRRIPYGPPVTQDTLASTLIKYRIPVAFGVKEPWDARNLRFDIGWNMVQGNMTFGEAYEMGSTALERLIGVRYVEDDLADLIVYEAGHAFELSSKPLAIISPELEYVHLL